MRYQNRTLLPQIHSDPRFIFELMHELGIEPRTLLCERLQNKRNFRPRPHQHPGRRIRSLAPRFSPLDNQNPQPLLAKRNGQREPNDPRANDDDVPGLHRGIVMEEEGG